MDYVHADNLEEYITTSIQAALDGIAGARTANQLVLNPQTIDFEVMVLFEENAVETEATQTPALETTTQTDTPARVTTTRTNVVGGSSQTTSQVHPSRSLVTGNSGADRTTQENDYEEFE